MLLLVYFAYSIVKDLYVFKFLSLRRAGRRRQRDGQEKDGGDAGGDDRSEEGDRGVFGSDRKDKQISMVPMSAGSPLGNPLFGGGGFDDY